MALAAAATLGAGTAAFANGVNAYDLYTGTSGVFGDLGLDGGFDDTFNFATGSGNLNVSVTTTSTGIDFTKLLFDGIALQAETSSPFDPNTRSYGLSNVIETSPIQTVEVAGSYAGSSSSTGSYSGTISFEPVSAAPEPSTWLLMFGGIGGIGFMMRRAKKTMGSRFKDALSA